MATPRITTLSIGGLVTAPGKEAYNPGACSRLRNVKFIGKNKIKGMQTYSTPTQGAGNGDAIGQTIELKNNKFATIAQSGGGSVTYGGNVSTQSFTVPSYCTPFGYYFSRTGYCSPMILRDRVLVQSTFGVWANDFSDPDFTDAQQRVWRSAGLPQPNIASIVEADGQTIPTDTMVSYGVLYRRTYPDGYELRSPGSVVQLKMNDSGVTKDNTIKVSWAYSDDIKAGDAVELYRSIGINDPSVTYSSAFDTGTTLYLVGKVIVTSTDATNKFVNITDQQMMDAPDYATSGEQWYPGPTAEGPTQQDNQPPTCLVQCAWKGQAFYANFIDYPTVTLQARGPVGFLGSDWDRANGIGVRLTDGTVTAGSANVTGVTPAYMAGVKIGQTFIGDPTMFPSTARVSGVSGTTITLNTNALTSGTGLALADSVNLDGVYYRCAFLGDLVQNVGASGLYEITTSETVFAEQGSQQGVSVTIRPIHYRASMTVKATNGGSYLGSIPDSNATAATITGKSQPNIVRYSKGNLPEAVPYDNEIPVGLGAIIALTTTTNYVYAWCTDGLYTITGVEGNFRVDVMDQSLILATPKASSSMTERCFGITNRGLVRVSVESGIETLSRGVFDSLISGQAFRASQFPWLQCDASQEELWILYQGTSFGAQAVVYIWNNRYEVLSEVYLSGAVNTATNGWLTCIAINSGDQYTLPAITVGLYTGITKPKYAVFDGFTGSALPVAVFLRELGDSNTVKQWVDFQVMLESVGVGETVQSLVTFPDGGAVGTGTLTNARNDARINFGIPRTAAVRPEIKLGFALPSPSRALEILGISTRVIPQTTNSEVR